jgi:hypothetical protein
MRYPNPNCIDHVLDSRHGTSIFNTFDCLEGFSQSYSYSAHPNVDSKVPSSLKNSFFLSQALQWGKANMPKISNLQFQEILIEFQHLILNGAFINMI